MLMIKASRIGNLTDARYFAAKEVQYIGFNLEENTEGAIAPAQMKAIREWVEGPRITGEFNGAPIDEVREAVSFYALDAVQLGAGYTAEALQTLQGVETIQVIDGRAGAAAALANIEAKAPFVTFFLIDFTGADPFSDIEAWQNCCARHKCFLHLAVSADETSALIQKLRPAGLSLTGGDEEAVGVKSFDDIDAIFELLEA